jgi:hypothetical protein
VDFGGDATKYGLIGWGAGIRTPIRRSRVWRQITILLVCFVLSRTLPHGLTRFSALNVAKLLPSFGPPGFVKIRHFGFLANRNRSQALRLCRQHLRSCVQNHPIPEVLAPEQRQALERRCPRCAQGTLHIVARFSSEELMIYIYPATAVDSIDSS